MSVKDFSIGPGQNQVPVNGLLGELAFMDSSFIPTRGVATIASGGSSIVVSHGLDAVPVSVNVTPFSNMGTTSWWADTFTSTTFTIHTSATVSTSTNFGWSASQ